MADQKYALLVDYTYYSGNHAAEIGCKEELGLPLEQFGIKEVQVGPFKKGEGNDGDAWEWFYIPCPSIGEPMATRPASVRSRCRSTSPLRCTTVPSKRWSLRWQSSIVRWFSSSCNSLVC